MPSLSCLILSLYPSFFFSISRGVRAEIVGLGKVWSCSTRATCSCYMSFGNFPKANNFHKVRAKLKKWLDGSRACIYFVLDHTPCAGRTINSSLFSRNCSTISSTLLQLPSVLKFTYCEEYDHLNYRPRHWPKTDTEN